MKKYIIKQEDELDCGACALLSIIKYYQGNVPLEIIKIDTLTNNQGTNFYYLKEAAKKYGFDARGLKTDDLSIIKLPCIAQVKINNINHFVVIYKIENTITLMDPKQGIVKLNNKEFIQIYQGHVLELIPNCQIINYDNSKAFEHLLKEIFKQNRKAILIILLISLPIIILTLISSFSIIFILKYQQISLVIIIIILTIFLNYIKDRLVSSLNCRINYNIIQKYINHIFNLPLNYLQLKRTGDLTNRVNDLYSVKDFFSKTIIEIILNLILLIACLCILICINPKLSITILIVSIIYLIISYYINKKVYYKALNILESDNQFLDNVIEYITKIKSIKCLNSDYFINKINDNIFHTLDNKYLLDKQLNLNNMYETIIEEGIFLFIIIYQFYFKINYLDIILYITIYNYYLNSFKYFIKLMPSAMYFKGILKPIKSIFDIEPEEVISKNTSGSIKINNLSYSHNKLTNTITNLNLDIKAGDKVNISGSNGSGKTTLLDIIAGHIKIKDKVIIPEKVSYISQNAELFSGTILENIILNHQYNEKKFRKVEKLTCLKEVMKNKTNGYMSHIYISNISGGEKQRIILARHLYQDFNILLLDEALSEISEKKRSIILNNIFNYYKDKTIINVSHYRDEINYNQQIVLTARKDKYANK